eukprot:403372017
MSNFFRGRGRGHYALANRNNAASATQSQQKRVVYKTPKTAANQLNQYYLDAFIKLKKDCDMRGNSNFSLTYKRIIGALSKYPMPILCAQQTLLLEGVGDILGKRFSELIDARHKEFEDSAFEIELLKQQGKNIPRERRTFAGLLIPECDIDTISTYSLKQYLVRRDMQVYRINNGMDDLSSENSKKRKFNQISNSEQEEEILANGAKKKKPNHNDSSAFLDTGSVSWSMIIAIYFLSLHDDRKSFYITMSSIVEMLEVLKNEFSDYMPFENDPKMLEQFSSGDLIKFKENSFIEIVESTVAKDPQEWKFSMTDKGKNRAKNLCKGVGLQIQLETDLENPTKNKITINMYDKDLMPVVDQLYMLDGTQVQQLKQENSLINRNQIFDPFVYSNEIKGNLGSKQINQFSHCKKEETSNMLNQSIFGNLIDLANKDLEEDEDEKDQDDDDLMMMDDGPYDSQIDSLLSKDFMNLMSDRENSNQPAPLQSLASLQAVSNQLTFPCQTSKQHIKTDSKQQIIKQEKKLLKQLNSDFQQATSEVILYVDNREKKNQRDVRNPSSFDIEDEECIEDEEQNNTKKKSKKNPNGTKKAKKKQAAQKEYIDYVLDFICERKTADDLAASILDGRYDEQKFRLKNSEINNVIYLVEGKPSQYCKIPLQVLNKAQIHTQIFHGFNVLRSDTIAQTLKWLTDMTREIKIRIGQMKQTQKNFENNVKDTLIDFKHFSNESGKNSNLDVQHIFSRQLRTIKGLGTDHVSTISRVFKTPYLMYATFKKCGSDEKKCLNLLNAGKMELMRSEQMYRQGLNISDQVIITDEGNPSIPKKIDDTDKIDLQNVIIAADPKFFNKVLKQFEQNAGIKMRKINKNQSESIYSLFCQASYKYRSKSNNGRNNKNLDEENDYEDME